MCKNGGKEKLPNEGDLHLWLLAFNHLICTKIQTLTTDVRSIVWDANNSKELFEEAAMIRWLEHDEESEKVGNYNDRPCSEFSMKE